MSEKHIPRPVFGWEEAAEKYDVDLGRVRVWNALSEFFLDTNLESEDLDRIAQILAESPFSIEEIKHINAQEITPICSANLMSIAGEWGVFDQDWLLPRCKKRQSDYPFDQFKKKSLVSQLLSCFVYGPESVYSQAEQIRKSFTPKKDAPKFTIHARIYHFPHEVSQRTFAMRTGFRCPMQICGDYHDCQLNFGENDGLLPGERMEPVGIEFLCPELVYPKIKVGTAFLLWEIRNIASGIVTSIEIEK